MVVYGTPIGVLNPEFVYEWIGNAKAEISYGGGIPLPSGQSQNTDGVIGSWDVFASLENLLSKGTRIITL
jgi:hypothetical protein